MEALERILREGYGFARPRAEEMPFGLSARAFRVREGARDVLVKIYDARRPDATRWTARIDMYAPVLDALRDPRLPVPVRASDGAWRYDAAYAQAVCFATEYIEGDTIGARGLTRAECRAAGALLGDIHNKDVSAFSLSEDDLDAGVFARPLAEEMRDDAARALIGTKLPALTCLMNDATRRGEILRKAPPPFVLTHGDAHGFNMLATPRGIALIDWEGMALSPAEADLMFFEGQPFFFDFMEEYLRARPGFRLDADVLLFCRQRRRLDDMLAFLREKDAPGAREYLQKELERLDDAAWRLDNA